MPASSTFFAFSRNATLRLNSPRPSWGHSLSVRRWVHWLFCPWEAQDTAVRVGGVGSTQVGAGWALLRWAGGTGEAASSTVGDFFQFPPQTSILHRGAREGSPCHRHAYSPTPGWSPRPRYDTHGWSFGLVLPLSLSHAWPVRGTWYLHMCGVKKEFSLPRPQRTHFSHWCSSDPASSEPLPCVMPPLCHDHLLPTGVASIYSLHLWGSWHGHLLPEANRPVFSEWKLH